MIEPTDVVGPLPAGYRGTVFLPDVVKLLDQSAPGEYPTREFYERYSEIVYARGSAPANRLAFSIALRQVFGDRVVCVGPPRQRAWRLTVKCQDDAEARMSPEAVGCQP